MSNFQLSIRIQGRPIPKARPRFTRSGHTYKDKRTYEQEKKIRIIAKQRMAELGLERSVDNLQAHMTFYFPMPVSWSKKKQKQRLFKPHTIRPDLDNLVKIIDSLNGIAWEDDCQVYKLFATKLWAVAPATHILILGDEGRDPFSVTPNILKP
jgi:Holliday junction resolvase RusA-like endonuclease